MGSRPSVDIGYGFEVDPMEYEHITDLSRQEQEEFEEMYEVAIVRHGALEYGDENYAIFVEDAHVHGDWDDPIYLDNMKNWPEREEQLKRAAEALGVTYQKPRFMALLSYG